LPEWHFDCIFNVCEQPLNGINEMERGVQMKTVRAMAIMTVLGIALFSIPGMNYGAGGFSLNIASDDFYLSVGGYDYCNYYDDNFAGDLYAPHGPGMSFHTILNDYGQWVYYGQLGDVWVPRVAFGWCPYLHGQWNLTPYGWTWVSYEPWGWIPHHYGHWLFTSMYGWVWIPGYEYYPARVNWITCGNYIGWAPMPPGGHYHHRGPWRGNYGFYHKPIYVNNVYINNYVLINNRHFTVDNVYSHYASQGNAGHVFANAKFKLVEMRKGPDRHAVERFTGKKVLVRDVDVRNMNINGRKVVYHRPRGGFEKIKHYANSTIEHSIAPAFAEQKIAFKGTDSRSAKSINRLFRQEKKQIKTRTFKPSATSGAATGKGARHESSGMSSGPQSSAGKGKIHSPEAGTSKSSTAAKSKGSSSVSQSSTKGVSSGKSGTGSKKTGKNQTTRMKASSSESKSNKGTTGKGKVSKGSSKSSAKSTGVKDAAKGEEKAAAGDGKEKAASSSGKQGKSAASDQEKNKKGKK